jgi:sugar (pentulose or hexulose) kinase
MSGSRAVRMCSASTAARRACAPRCSICAGKLIASDSTPYPIDYPQVSWAEQNPEHWWQAVRVTVPNVLREAGVHPRQVQAA